MDQRRKARWIRFGCGFAAAILVYGCLFDYFFRVPAMEFVPDLQRNRNSQRLIVAQASAAVAIVLAGLCVWLTVRVINRRERWATRMLAVVVALPVLYVLSICPACWVTSRINAGENVVANVYRPVTLFFPKPGDPPSPVGSVIYWYANLGAASDWSWWTWSDFSGWSNEWKWSAPPSRG